MRIVTLKAALLSLSLLLIGAAGALAQLPAGWEPFTRSFQAYVDAEKIVGASVLYMRDGKVLAQYNTGYADRDAQKKVDNNTIFHWGSITKALTAIGIMQLRDHGKLKLDDQVTRHIPELRRVHDPYGRIDSITIRMLMAHTAGFQNSTWPYDKGLPWEPFEPTDWNQLVAMMPYERLLFSPGERYSYSNPAFVYLGRIIEQQTGDPWDGYIYKNFFLPLGMQKSYFRGTPYHMKQDRSRNYYVRKDSSGAERIIDNGPDFDPGITSPNGAWNAPLSDLAKYVAFLTGKPGNDVVLKRSSLEEMWVPVKPTGALPADANAVQNWMGLSFVVMKQGNKTLLGHTGSQAAFRSYFYFNPATSAAIIAAFNTTNATPASTQWRAVMDATYGLLW